MLRALSYYLLFFLFICSVSLVITPSSFAQQVSPTPPKSEFMKATVIGSEGEKKNPYSDYQSTIQVLDVVILDGSDIGKTVQVQYDAQRINDLILHTGDTVILTKTSSASGPVTYSIESKYRLAPLSFIGIAFVLLVVFVAGWKGIGSFIGLGISLGIIFVYIVPQILAGQDPLLVCMIGAVGILLFTTYAAHGISKQTSIALVSTLLALFLTYGLSVLFVKLSLLTGYIDENSIAVHFGTGHLIDVKGLLLGGIIIGTLGALNDVTTTQAATMFELVRTDKQVTRKQLFKKGLFVGREHVVSLINTLVLAYAGSSLTVFLFLFYNASYYPLWVILNSETLSEEVVRTIAGTMGLVLVVPIVTFIAAYFATKTQKSV
ncbi:MAG TPA: YibE/F family protein [Candidatus Sulfotelmatobacter sp.]|jgi:uncharacterized membrane protein|nr:YibE/F family protein [Candidatus Sulfotelmatobacter sp.]